MILIFQSISETSVIFTLKLSTCGNTKLQIYYIDQKYSSFSIDGNYSNINRKELISLYLEGRKLLALLSKIEWGEYDTVLINNNWKRISSNSSGIVYVNG